jgi:phosphatidylglycerol:prolipoprotein diacylglycerol transferase
MHPVLFNLGSIPIHSYGVLIAIGFLAGTWLMRREALKQKWNSEKIVDYCFMSLLVGFAGARTIFIITQWDYFIKHPMEVFYVWEGGLVFYGGPLAAIPYTLWFVKKNKMSIRALGDIAVQSLTLGHGFGRLGCFAAGCCHGSACNLPWAVRLNSPLVEESLRGVPIHPVQIYESAALFILFAILRYFYKRRSFSGQIILIYFMAYSIIRPITEAFRGDTVRGFVFGSALSTSQFISIIMFLGALAYYLYLRSKPQS